MSAPPPPPPRRYIVVGRDGRHHDVDLQKLRTWAAENSITPAYQVYSHATEKWSLASELPELADAFQIRAAGLTPRNAGGVGCLAGLLAVVGIVLIFIYPPLGILLLFVALVFAVVFRK